MSTMISVDLASDQPEVIVRAAETLVRAAIGLALDGVEVTITLGQSEEEDAERMAD